MVVLAEDFSEGVFDIAVKFRINWSGKFFSNIYRASKLHRTDIRRQRKVTRLWILE